MTRLGVSFDFKKEYYHSWLFCIIPMSVNIIFIVLSYITMDKNLQNRSTIDTIRFFTTYVICNAIMLLAIVSFLTLICVLHKRFLVLNSMLRFDNWIFNNFLCSARFRSSMKSMSFRNRKRFLNENTLKMSAKIQREDSFNTIKFIGRQHSLLTGIVDQLNYCYSFQV